MCPQAFIDHTSPSWRCAICNIPSTQQCSLCRGVAYCGREHQKDDWPNHKYTCPGNAPTGEGRCKIIYNYDSKGVRRGRRLIAGKAIQRGDIIVRESPLAWVPKHDIRPIPFVKNPFFREQPENPAGETPGEESSGEKKTSACIVCGDTINDNRSCSHCHWPVCSEECEKNVVHSSECQVFQGNHIPRHIQQLLPNRFLFVLRCLLLPSTDPRKWRELMELEYNPDEMTKKYSPTDMFQSENAGGSNATVNVEEQQEEVIDKVAAANESALTGNKYDLGITKLLKYYGIKCELEWVTHLMKVIKWNVIYDYEFDTRAMLFYLTSAAAHSCIPNTEMLFSRERGSLYLRALVDLKPGEPILVSRDPLALMLTAQIRQRRLKYMSGWDGFRCNCARCSDWTELGTNFATLQCRKELKNWGNDASAIDPSPCSGMLMATKPLDHDFEWKCPTCKFRVSGNLQEDALNMRNLLSQVFHFADADPSYIQDGIRTVESFQLWFHPNHSFIFQTKMRIMDTVNLMCAKRSNENGGKLYITNKLETLRVPGFDKMELIKKLFQYGVDCLKTADSIFPGSSRIRGHIFLFLGWAKWCLHRGEVVDSSLIQTDFIQYVDKTMVKEAVQHLTEAQKILSFYKEVSQDEADMHKFAFNLAKRIPVVMKL